MGQLGKASVDVRFWRVRDVSAKVHHLLPVTSTVSIFHSNTDGMLCVRANKMPHFSEEKNTTNIPVVFAYQRYGVLGPKIQVALYSVHFMHCNEKFSS